MLVGIVADHEFKEFLLEARIIVGQGIGLAEEADQAQNVLGRIGESEIMQFFKVDLSFIKDIHFYVDQIAEIHLLVHCIQNRIYNGKMVVSLLVFYPPDRCHLFILFRILRYFFPKTHLFPDLCSRFLQMTQILYHIRVGYLIVNFVAIV